MKQVQIPRNTTEFEDGVIGPEGQLRMDTTRKEIRLHDGLTPGGNRIPNLDLVKQLIATGVEGATAGLTIFATEADLMASTPPASSISQFAVVTEAGKEAMYYWKLADGDSGTVASDVSGVWHRYDSSIDTIVRLWRMGFTNISTAGVAPVADQDTTPWINGGVIYLWDGVEYAAATPELFARMIGKLGDFFVGTFSMPDRVAETLVSVADCNAVTESGWWFIQVDAANAPVTTKQPLEHRQLDANTAYQTVFVMGTTDKWVRSLAAGVWGAWTQVSGQLPARLSSTGSAGADLNNMLDSGFYTFAAGAANAPFAGHKGVVMATRYDATNAMQMCMDVEAVDFYIRVMTANVWAAWRRMTPTITVSAGDPVGGQDGDFWLKTA